MINELEYFRIDDSYGGNQDWMKDPWMHIGGCAALTALDSLIYLQFRMGMHGITPLPCCNENDMSREWYCRCGMKMKPYLRPRLSGVNKLSIYTEGLRQYLHDRVIDGIVTCELDNSHPYREARTALRQQIDMGLPVPYLMLNCSDRRYKEYKWHWFLIIGYEDDGEKLMVKTATYGESEWIDFNGFWNSGYQDGSGMIIYTIDGANE